jgi:hypothetical protein
MSSKRKPPSLAGRPLKVGKAKKYCCSKPLCKVQFVSSQSLAMHVTKNKACADALSSVNTTSFPNSDSEALSPDFPLEPDSDSESDDNLFKSPWNCLVPWDDDDKNDELADSMNDVGDDDSHNNQDGSLTANSTNSPLVTVAVGPAGVSFTPSKFVETKLLKYLMMRIHHISFTRIF